MQDKKVKALVNNSKIFYINLVLGKMQKFFVFIFSNNKHVYFLKSLSCSVLMAIQDEPAARFFQGYIENNFRMPYHHTTK